MLAGRLLNIYLFIWTVTPQASCPAIRLSSRPLVTDNTVATWFINIYISYTHTLTRCFSRCVFLVFAFFGQLDAAINCSAKWSKPEVKNDFLCFRRASSLSLFLSLSLSLLSAVPLIKKFSYKLIEIDLDWSFYWYLARELARWRLPFAFCLPPCALCRVWLSSKWN